MPDNVKVVVNGKILQNEKAPTSRKYKNFYFSGDLDNGEKQTLVLAPNKFLMVENAVELWYDQSPEVWISFILFDDNSDFMEELEDFNDKKKTIRKVLEFAVWVSKRFKPDLENARLCLSHAIRNNPTDDAVQNFNIRIKINDFLRIP